MTLSQLLDIGFLFISECYKSRGQGQFFALDFESLSPNSAWKNLLILHT